MGQISDIKNPWRQKLIGAPASFRGVVFHVESGTISGGRRTVVHEYPKRDTPYAEDMGLQAKRWQFTGYIIYKPSGSGGGTGQQKIRGRPVPAAQPVTGSNLRYDYVKRRDELQEALDREDAGTLFHPVFAPGGKLVMCDRYSMTETRERGGYTAFEMSFVFAGSAGNSITVTNTSAGVTSAASTTNASATSAFNSSHPSFPSGSLG